MALSAQVRRRIRIAIIAFGGVLLVALAGVVIFAVALAQSFDSGRTVIPNAFPSTRAPAATGAAANAVNILVLGSDTRGSTPTSLASIRAQRSDTMLLVHIPADRKHVYVISIMRDSWVTIPGHGTAKINAALSWGGVPLVIQTVERLLDTRIDHVAVVSFTGFEGITDALGGVTIDNPIAFTDRGHTFARGRITLNGTEALIYVRARYPFADGDYQRVRNQQRYLKGVLATTLSSGTVLNPGRLLSVVRAASPYLLTDAGLSSSTLAGLAAGMSGLRASDVSFFSAPTSGTGMEGSQSVVYLDDVRLAELATDLRNDNVGAYEPCTVDVC